MNPLPSPHPEKNEKKRIQPSPAEKSVWMHTCCSSELKESSLDWETGTAINREREKCGMTDRQKRKRKKTLQLQWPTPHRPTTATPQPGSQPTGQPVRFCPIRMRAKASNLPHVFRVGSGATDSRNWAAGGGGGNGCVGRAGWRRRIVFLHPLAVGHHLFRHAHNPPKDAVKVGQQKKVRPTPMTKEKFNIFLWEWRKSMGVKWMRQKGVMGCCSQKWLGGGGGGGGGGGAYFPQKSCAVSETFCSGNDGSLWE